MPEKGRVSKKFWGQGCDGGTFHTYFHTFCKKEIDNLLSENKAKTERIQLDRLHVLFEEIVKLPNLHLHCTSRTNPSVLPFLDFTFDLSFPQFF